MGPPSMIMGCRFLALALLWASFGIAVPGDTSTPACQASLLQASERSAEPCSCMDGCLSRGGEHSLCTKHCEAVAACVADGKTCDICVEGALSMEADAVGAYIKDCVLAGQPFPKCMAKVAAYMVGKSDDSEDPCSCMETCLSKGLTEAVCAEPCEGVNVCAATGVKTCEMCEMETLSASIDGIAAALRTCVMSGMQMKKCMATATAAFGVGPESLIARQQQAPDFNAFFDTIFSSKLTSTTTTTTTTTTTSTPCPCFRFAAARGFVFRRTCNDPPCFNIPGSQTCGIPYPTDACD